jgi:hypothetical protein
MNRNKETLRVAHKEEGANYITLERDYAELVNFATNRRPGGKIALALC